MDSEPVVLDNIPVTLTLEDCLNKLGFSAEYADEMRPLYERTARRMRPKAALRRLNVDGISGDDVVLGGTAMRSRVMAVNLSGKESAAAYVTTCGRELDALSAASADSIERFWQDSLNELVLTKAMQEVRLYAERKLGYTPLRSMSPGSLADWPITQQAPLFNLIGDVSGLIGVELNDSFLMLPIKSVSGLFFQSDEHYVNCMLCPRQHCPNRAEPFNEQAYRERYALET